MREDNHRRKFRARASRTGADLICKEANEFDGCEQFMAYFDHMRDWKARHENEVNFNRPDPFGIHDYNVDYSLNKKKRWTINEEIVDRIEEVQDQHLKIRVSSSVHLIDRSNLYYDKTDHICKPNNVPCLEYHTVSRDGKTVTHRKSEHGRTRLRDFTHKSRPCRRSSTNPLPAEGEIYVRRGGRRGGVRQTKIGRSYRVERFVERYDWSDRGLAAEENEEHQKIHIHYTTQKITDRPSLHNKMARKRERLDSDSREEQDRLSYSFERKQNYDETIPDDFGDDELDSDDIDDLISLNLFPFVSEYVGIPTVVEDLSVLFVRKEKRRKMKKRKPIRRFVDEFLKASIFIPATTTSAYNNEDEFEEDESPTTSFSSTPSIPLVSLPTEMFTRIPLSSLPPLPSTLRLPCFPPAWEIHQRDTLRVLCKSLLTSVVARQYGDELRLAIIDDCASSAHSSRSHLPPLKEIFPDFESVEGGCCEICFGEMDMNSEDRLSHPFALSCSHLFCTGCWLSHINESIHTKRLPAACLDPSCPCTASISAAKVLLSSSSIDIYETATIDYLKSAEKLTSCPECKRLHFTGGSLRMLCPCGTSLCSHCSSVDHSPLGCDVFAQYNSYMRKNGFSSIYATSSESPIIRDLTKCPKCCALMQRTEGCNHLTCSCKMEFCFICGQKWAASHYSCTRNEKHTRITMIDVFNSNEIPLLVPSLLTLAIEARTVLINRRKELRKRLRPLSFTERKRVETTFVQLSLIVELCYLSLRRSRRARKLADTIRFRLDEFFNTGDKNIEMKSRALEVLKNSIEV